VNEPPAVNTSSLIFLARGGCLDLLLVAGPRLIFPQSVATEIHRRGLEDVTSLAIRRVPWLAVVPDPKVPALIQSGDLGPGEAAMLAWAHAHPGTEVSIDDHAGRRCATAIDIPVRGTLGLVLKAKQRGIIDNARIILEQMVQAGMYLSPRVFNQALVLVGE